MQSNTATSDAKVERVIRTHWRFSTAAVSKGAALLIHGLNLKPGAMAAISRRLSAAGIDVLQVTLSGHDTKSLSDMERIEEFRRASYTLWRSEVAAAYVELADYANDHQLPKYLVAYSIGALLGADLLIDAEPAVAYDKMVLLSPALSLRATSQLLRPFSLFPDLIMPSFSPSVYHANWGTPMAAYNALYDGLHHFEKGASNQLNIPSLIVIDKGDELVSAHGIEGFIESHQLTQWQFSTVRKGSDAMTWYHHLLIDELTLGRAAWNDMMQQIEDFLLQD